MAEKIKKLCTIWRCPHVSGRPDHCANPMCSNYYQKCPVHRGSLPVTTGVISRGMNMSSQTEGGKRCPLCHRTMDRAVDHWVCAETEAHAPVLAKVMPFSRRKKSERPAGSDGVLPGVPAADDVVR